MSEYNPAVYYTPADKQRLQSLADDLDKALKGKQNAEIYYNAWSDFYNRWRNSNGLTWGDPITGAGIWYPGNAGATISNTVNGWKKKLDDFTARYVSLQQAYSALSDELHKKYYATWLKQTAVEQQKALVEYNKAQATAASNQALADSNSALASIKNTEAITKFLEENAIFILIAIIVVIFIIIRFRRS